MVELINQRTPLLEPGDIVNARVANVELHEFEWQGKKEQKLKWAFTVVDEDSAWFNKDITGETSTRFVPDPRCKAYTWVTNLTGRAYEDNEKLETDDLIGLPCRIYIEHKPDKKGNNWMRARDVLPAGRAASSAAVVPEDAPF